MFNRQAMGNGSMKVGAGQTRANDRKASLPRRQKGFLIPLALFILVVMGGLSVAIVRMGDMHAFSPIQDYLSKQAYYAARAGAEYALHAIHIVPDRTGKIPKTVPSDYITSQKVKQICKLIDEKGKLVDEEKAKIDLPEMTNCSAIVRCEIQCLDANVDCKGSAPITGDVSITLTSSGFCGIRGQVWGERSIQISSIYTDETPPP